MKVLKFGGTSVGTAGSIKKAAEIVSNYDQRKMVRAVVVSAQKGITNLLERVGEQAASGKETYIATLQGIEKKHFSLIKELFPVKHQSQVLAHVKIMLNQLQDVLEGVHLLKELSLRTKDFILSFGERLSAYIFQRYLEHIGLKASFLDARELIVTDDAFGAARIQFGATNSRIRKHFKAHKKLQVITGFISANQKGQTTTLGRGGSDYTASVFGAAIGAKEIEIWTDVDGVMTADPKIVNRAFSLPSLSYVEAMELTHFGAKIIYPPTLQPAFSKNIPLRIRNTFNPDFPGTLISKKGQDLDLLIKGISSIKEVALVNFQGSGMVGVPGVASRLFAALAQARINLIMITQASSEHSICFAISPDDATKTRQILDKEFALEIKGKKIDPVVIEKRLSIVAIIGENMRQTPGIADRLFGALGKNGVNVVAIAQGSSELNVSVVINKRNLDKALKALHGTFFQENRSSINVFMVGVGLIGGTLLQQITNQFKFLSEERRLLINVVALANTKKMLFEETGISLKNWQEKLHRSKTKSDLKGFLKRMTAMNLPNTVFVDNTASEEVTRYYKDILSSNISIVTSNKIANSSLYTKFKDLQETAFNHGVKFLYETNVGAGLPVIGTLQDLILSGDSIIKIEGVLSGTISYIFNSFTEGQSFSKIVEQAKEMGYTEPDPRDDLNGMDVARKILILSRMVGFELELEDITIEPILPESCFKVTSVNAFFKELTKLDTVMDERRIEAANHGKVLRHVASLEDGKASIKLKALGPDHLFYGISGSDNMIAYTSERYKDKPLVVRGPGAGAEVTAAGVFAEIIKISDYLSR